MKKKNRSSVLSKRHRDYKYKDKKRGFDFELSLEQSKAIMSMPCFYCGNPESNGIDRMESEGKGHTLDNVVSCCKTCNMILSTLPWKAKLELREGLRAIYEKGLLKDWTMPCLLPYQKKQQEKEKQQDEWIKKLIPLISYDPIIQTIEFDNSVVSTLEPMIDDKKEVVTDCLKLDIEDLCDCGCHTDPEITMHTFPCCPRSSEEWGQNEA